MTFSSETSVAKQGALDQFKLLSPNSYHSLNLARVSPDCRSLLRQQIIHHVSYGLAFVLFLVALVAFSIGKSTCMLYGYANISRLGLLPLLTYYIVEGGKERQLQSISFIYAILAVIDIVFTIFFISLDNYFDQIPPESLAHFSPQTRLPPWVLDEFYRQLSVPFWYQELCILLSLPCFVQGFLGILLAYLIFTLKRDQQSYYRNFYHGDRALGHGRSSFHPSFLSPMDHECYSTCFFHDPETPELKYNPFLNGVVDEMSTHCSYSYGVYERKFSDPTSNYFQDDLPLHSKAHPTKTHARRSIACNSCCLRRNHHWDAGHNQRKSSSVCHPRHPDLPNYLKDRRRSTLFSPFLNDSITPQEHEESEKDLFLKNFEESTSDGTSPEKLDIIIHRA